MGVDTPLLLAMAMVPHEGSLPWSGNTFELDLAPVATGAVALGVLAAPLQPLLQQPGEPAAFSHSSHRAAPSAQHSAEPLIWPQSVHSVASSPLAILQQPGEPFSSPHDAHSSAVPAQHSADSFIQPHLPHRVVPVVV